MKDFECLSGEFQRVEQQVGQYGIELAGKIKSTYIWKV